MLKSFVLQDLILQVYHTDRKGQGVLKIGAIQVLTLHFAVGKGTIFAKIRAVF